MSHLILIFLLSITTFQQPNEALIDSLIKIKTDADREIFIRDNSEHINNRLSLALLRRADNAFMKSDYDGAVNIIAGFKAVAVSMKNRKAEGTAWEKLGLLYSLSNKPEKSMESYSKSLEIYRELYAFLDMAIVYSAVATIKANSGNRKAALDNLNNALKIYRDANIKKEMAETLERIALFHMEDGNLELASPIIEESLKAYAEAKIKLAGANQLLRIAEINYKSGKNLEAIEYYQRSLAMYEEKGERKQHSYIMHSIANVFYSNGDYSQAFQWYNKSLNIAQNTKNQRAITAALKGIGLIHSINANFQSALESFQQIQVIAEQLKDKQILVESLHAIAGTYFSLTEYDKAMEFYKHTLALYEELGNFKESAGVLLDIGIVHAARNELDEAMSFYRKAKELYANDPGGIADVLLHENLLYYHRAEYDKALEASSKAADLAKQADDNGLYRSALNRCGKAQLKLNLFNDATRNYFEAISLLENNAFINSGSSSRRYNENRYASYLGMIDLLLAQNKVTDAYNMIERKSVISRFHSLRSGKILITKSMSVKEQKSEIQLLNEITTFQNKIRRAYEITSTDKGSIEKLKQQLNLVNQRYAKFKQPLYTLHPTLRVMRSEGKPLTIQSAINSLSDTKTLQLQFVDTGEYLYLFTLAKNKSIGNALKVAQLEVNRAELLSKITTFTRQILNKEPTFETTAHELYDLLLKPVEAQFEGKTKLVIIPDSILWNLPYHALINSKNRFVIENYSVSYISASIDRLLTQSIKLPPVTKRLVITNPTLNTDAIERIGSEVIAGESETMNEVKATPNNQLIATTYSEASATKKTFIDEAPKYNNIHLNTFALFSNPNPIYSSIFFSDKDMNIGELFNIDIKAGSFVITGYKQKPSQTLSGQSIASLGWALFTAGSKSVIVDSYHNDQFAASNLMDEYHRINDSMSIDYSRRSTAVIWREATKKFISTTEYPHPFYWAGFTVFEAR